MAYNTEERITPFWSENSGFMTGRDPLGIQNSSITVYGRLLPGMTNLTQRLRYYGIYCWLLKEYRDLDAQTFKKDLKHHYNFVRRAELIIAFMMGNEYPEVKSVIGSNYVNTHISDLDQDGYYDIELGADKFNKEKTSALYWDYPSGALGQYYAGSLINLNLIETSNKFFQITERGLNLALAFEKSIPKATRIFFLTLIEKTKIDLEDIRLISSFNLTGIPDQSEEWFFYFNMLTEDDGVNFKNSSGEITIRRRESMRRYLDFCSENLSAVKFDEWIYSNFSKVTEVNSSSFGWYYYFINEAFHFSLETIFWGMLRCLEGRTIQIHSYINEVKEIILNQNSSYLAINATENLESIILQMSNSNLTDNLCELERLSKSESNWQIAIGKAVELLSVIYIHIEPYKEKIKAFENLNFLSHQKGNVSEHMTLYVANNFSLPYNTYVEKIITLLINNHIETAYRKMGNSEVNLLKFIIEDNIIGHIQTMPPKHTTPRIQTLHNFLRDLQLIDDLGLPTDLANSSLVKEEIA